MLKFCNDISFSCENCCLNFLLAQFKSIIMSISKRRPSKNIRVSFSQEMTENKEDKTENVLTMGIGWFTLTLLNQLHPPLFLWMFTINSECLITNYISQRWRKLWYYLPKFSVDPFLLYFLPVSLSSSLSPAPPPFGILRHSLMI